VSDERDRDGESIRPRKLRDLNAPRQALERALDSHSQTFGTFFLARFLGFEVSFDHDTCTVAFDVREDMHNPRAVLQGGVVATALDVAMGHLINHLQSAAATIALNVQYHRPVSDGRLRCVAQVLHRGSRVWSMTAFAYDGADNLIASATSSFQILRPA
jgi:uncharacterized protein (TIGR00369 family)